MRFFASSFGSVDVSRFDGKDKKLWPGWIFFTFVDVLIFPFFASAAFLCILLWQAMVWGKKQGDLGAKDELTGEA